MISVPEARQVMIERPDDLIQVLDRDIKCQRLEKVSIGSGECGKMHSWFTIMSHNPVLTLYGPHGDPIFNKIRNKKQGEVRKNLWGWGREELVRWGGGRGRRRKGDLAAEE